MVIDHAMESMPISTTWDIVFPVHMSTNVRVPQKKPSVPDFFLETDGPGGNIALLILEVGFSQTEKDLMKKIRGFAMECKNIQIIATIDACESQPYRRPNNKLDLAVMMERRDVLMRKEWKVVSDNPAFGSVMSSARHPWVKPLTIKVKAWLCHPDGEFSLDKMNSSSYYACVVSLTTLFLIKC